MAGRNEEIAIKIGAKDEASKVIEKLAKRIDGMEADEARITVTAQTDKLEAQLDRAKKKLEGLEGDEATVQARLVGTLEEDLEQANKLLEQLDGQTATVKIDSVGAKQGIDDLGKSADSSKSVLANMVGNATQDLGTLGGVAGSAGVAIGQMGEYMADAKANGEGMGSIVKNFGAMVGPIAAISAATILISGAMKSIADSKAFKAKEVQDFSNALRDGASFIEAINEDLRETEQIIGRADGIAGMFEDSKDIVKDLDAMGLTIDDITAAMAGTDAEWRAFIGPMQADLDKLKTEGGKGFLGLQTDEQMDDLNHLRDTIEILNEKRAAYIQGADEAAVKERFYGEAVDDTTEAVDKAATSHQRTKDAITDNSAALDRHRDALDKARQKTDDLRIANEKLRGDLDRDEAYLRLQDTFQDTEDAGIEAWLAVSSGAADADQVVRAYKLQQIDAKRALDDFITRFGEIPPAKQIEINTLIDEGNFAAAKTEIDKLTEAQTVDVRFNVIRPRSIGVGSAGGGGVPLLAGAMSGIPTGVQIAKQIGTVRIPADVYVRSTPRITGIRD